MLQDEMRDSRVCSALGPGFAARMCPLCAQGVLYERSVSCVIPGVLQEARQGHDAGLAVRLLWSYTERIFPSTAVWSFIQKTGEWTHLHMQCKTGGSSREKGPTRDRGCI